MEFEEALKFLKEGKRVRRKCWADGQFIERRGVGLLWICNESGPLKYESVPCHLFFVADWEVIKEKTFSDLKDGAFFKLKGEYTLCQKASPETCYIIPRGSYPYSIATEQGYADKEVIELEFIEKK